MLYRTLIFSTFILIAWLSLEYSQIKRINLKINNQLLDMRHNVHDLHQLVLNNQSLLQQNIELSAAKVEPKINKEKARVVKKEKKKTLSEIVDDLNKRLLVINKHQKKKEINKASRLLKMFKEDVWKVRKEKGVDKKIVMSIMSSIDSTLTMWKKNNHSYTTKTINGKLKKLINSTAGTTDNKSKEKPKVIKKDEKYKSVSVIKDLNKKLMTINGYQEKKELDKAAKLLSDFKKEIWKVRKQKDIDKKLVLSIMSSVDITLKRWKEDDKKFTTKIIESKLKLLSSIKGGGNDKG